ncbi:hypothetical protein [Dechloromonas hortensis]|uniref:hypothetical protein n=1 Tax=Dechloromonas hortensis TaxID=337779 RepID=UPI0012920E3F|nr:hypothetical protein [Dechloromonas hortensis]
MQFSRKLRQSEDKCHFLLKISGNVQLINWKWRWAQANDERAQPAQYATGDRLNAAYAQVICFDLPLNAAEGKTREEMSG